MTAARLTWVATRYEHRDPETGALAVDSLSPSLGWTWELETQGGARVECGVGERVAGAKAKAGKALERWKLGKKGEVT